MPVQSVNPYVVPAKAQAEYPLLWLKRLNVQTEGFNSANISAEMISYRNVETDVEGVLVSEAASDKPALLWADHDVFSLAQRQPWVEAAFRAKLATYGIVLPDQIVATLFVVDLIANLIGSAAEATPPAPEPEPEPDPEAP